MMMVVMGDQTSMIAMGIVSGEIIINNAGCIVDHIKVQNMKTAESKNKKGSYFYGFRTKKKDVL